jgi:hypothetical protein
MIYSDYLNLITQLNFEKKAHLSVSDEIIAVTQVDDRFILSSRIGEEFPLELGPYSLDAPFSKLVCTEEGLYFIQEVKNLDQFIKFKILMPNYLDLLHFWKEVIQDLETAALHR